MKESMKSLNFEPNQLEFEHYTFSKSGKSIIIIPIVHDSLLYSQFVAKAIRSMNPDRVAIELPIQLESLILRGIDDLPQLSIIYRQGSFNQVTQKKDLRSSIFLIHPGEAVVWSAKEALSNGIPIHFIDHLFANARQTIDLPITPIQVALLGWKRVLEEILDEIAAHIRHPTHSQRSLKFGVELIRLLSRENTSTILFPCGGAHLLPLTQFLVNNGFALHDQELLNLSFKLPQLNNQWGLEKIQDPYVNSWEIGKLNPKNIHHYFADLPYFIHQFSKNPANFNILNAIQELFLDTGRIYKERLDDEVSLGVYLKMFQYLRNLSYLKFLILPQLLDIIYAAKGMVDDDYAYELFRLAISYPSNKINESSGKKEIILPPDSNVNNFVKITFRKRFRRQILSIQENNDEFDPVPSESYIGEWKDIWDKYSKFGYVSYPPEDEFIESYLDKLRRQINDILAEENSSTMEFTTSIEDGIDYRETARKYHERKIYVKQLPKFKYQIGTIIVQFIEEPLDLDKYNYHSTLFAEHDKESHLSVITTTPETEFVGPGICRVKYAALISQFPPLGFPRLINKNSDDLKLRLIETAMQMSLSKIIGFIAPKPPQPALKTFAASYGFRILYIPLSHLTKLSLHRLRTMHLLSHIDLRDIAKEYIGF